MKDLQLPNAIQVHERGITVHLSQRQLRKEEVVNQVMDLSFHYLSGIEEWTKWALADLYVWCEDHRLDPLNYIDQTKLATGTIRNRAVAVRVFPLEKRVWSLSISHYIIASNRSLTPEDRVTVMDLAEQGGLSREAMKVLVRQYIGEADPEQAIFSPQRLYTNVSTMLNRSRRVYEWASANGLPDDLRTGYKEIEQDVKAEVALLWERIQE